MICVYFGININVESHGFSCVIEPESLKEINDLKIQYIDELVEVINNFSFETAQVPITHDSPSPLLRKIYRNS